MAIWTRVADHFAGSNPSVFCFAEHGGYLWAGVDRAPSGEVWRSANGTTWSLVEDLNGKEGWSTIAASDSVDCLFSFGGNLYLIGRDTCSILVHDGGDPGTFNRQDTATDPNRLNGATGFPQFPRGVIVTTVNSVPTILHICQRATPSGAEVLYYSSTDAFTWTPGPDPGGSSERGIAGIEFNGYVYFQSSLNNIFRLRLSDGNFDLGEVENFPLNNSQAFAGFAIFGGELYACASSTDVGQTARVYKLTDELDNSWDTTGILLSGMNSSGRAIVATQSELFVGSVDDGVDKDLKASSNGTVFVDQDFDSNPNDESITGARQDASIRSSISGADLLYVGTSGGGNIMTTVFAEGGHQVSAFSLQTAGWREGQYASTLAVKSVDGTVSGYSRQNHQTKDDSSSDFPLGSNTKDADDWALRYIRNYYTIPPALFWQLYRSRVDLTEGALNSKEDGFRWFTRIYKHNQSHYLSGPCTVEGLIPHTFIHPESPAAGETFTFSSAINLNSFRLQFKWEPTFGHPDIQGTEQELARLSIDGNNYIRLYIAAQDPYERQYNLSDLHGGHDPKFVLEKVRGGSVVDSVEVICYYGYENREPSMETTSDTIVFTLDHMSGTGGYLSLEVEKFKTRGSQTSTSDIVAYSGDSIGSIIYNGVGWYSPPRIIVEDQSVRTNYRKLPVFRSGLHMRNRPFDLPAIQSGDRDVTSGQRVQDNPYLLVETFTRSDSGNLGSDWDIIQSDGDGRNAGNGFDVASNKAQAFGTTFERWDAQPAHRDYLFQADVAIGANNDLVGLLARYPPEFFDNGNGDICGFGVELVQTAPTTASVRLVIWWLDTRTVLSTGPLSSYAQDTEYRLRITCEGSNLTGEVFDPADLDTPLGSTTAVSTLFKRPGRLGIYCEAPTAAVTIDNVSAEPLFALALTD